MQKINSFVFAALALTQAILTSHPAFAVNSALIRKVAIWDNHMKAGEGAEHVRSVQQLLRVAGISFDTIVDNGSSTSNNFSTTAALYNMVIVSNYMSSSNATTTALTNYVQSGGTLIVPQMRYSSLNALFGISAVASSLTINTYMNWTLPNNSYYAWCDDANEKQISFAKHEAGYASFKTCAYTLNPATPTATALANYPVIKSDGSIDTAAPTTVAVTRNKDSAWNGGQAIALGFKFKDLVAAPQVNRDLSAQRTYSNGFEPTTDTIALFIRSVFTEATPVSPYLHTSIRNSDATLMVTHDNDSSTAMKNMQAFSTIEKAWHIRATYNQTVHWMHDVSGRMAAFYNDTPYTTPTDSNLAVLRNVINVDGHALASHSVSHAPDFNLSSVFPKGTSLPIPLSSYNPQVGAITTISTGASVTAPTTGGTVLGEVLGSKVQLELDFPGKKIRTFRSGHLSFNDYQIDVLAANGYSFDTTFSANDVLTHFPYAIAKGRSSSADPYSNQSPIIYEIPMAISDVISGFSTDMTVWSPAATNWTQVLLRTTKNHSPTVLLIHPNNVTSKVYALNQFLADINSNPALQKLYATDMDSFGDYWKARDSIKFNSTWVPSPAPGTLTINIEPHTLTQTQLDDISFVVPGGFILPTANVKIMNNGTQLMGIAKDSIDNSTDAVFYRPGGTNFKFVHNP